MSGFIGLISFLFVWFVGCICVFLIYLVLGVCLDIWESRRAMKYPFSIIFIWKGSNSWGWDPSFQDGFEGGGGFWSGLKKGGGGSRHGARFPR